MSVIINEFEIVMDNEQEETPAAGKAAAEETQAAPPLAPSDVRDILRHQLARRERLWAH